MTTKKERREALERMTKAELVRTVVTLDGRVVKLLNELVHTRDVAEANSAAAVALQLQLKLYEADDAQGSFTGMVFEHEDGGGEPLNDAQTKLRLQLKLYEADDAQTKFPWSK